MELNQYQEEIIKFDVFTGRQEISQIDLPFLDKVLGLSGETGEVADKVKKIIRDKEGKISAKDSLDLAKELGDVLWYLATSARYLGLSLDEIAASNIAKLESRLARDQISGSGDNR